MKKYIAVLVILLAGASVIGTAIWRDKPQSSAEVKGAITKAESFIDVRTDQEWEAGHLDGAVHFDLARLQNGELPSLPKDTPIALYCRSGNRAGQALQILEQNGFTNVRNAGALADLQRNPSE